MGLRGKKREPLTHRRCRQVIESLQEQLLVQQKAAEVVQSRLEARIKKLEARLNQDSNNSSRPPSSDFPHRKYPRRKPSGKKRGGQKGHRGHSKRLFPADQVIETIVAAPPNHCKSCLSTALTKTNSLTLHHVVDFPEIVLQVKEYQCHLFQCERCKRKTAAPLPIGVSSGCLGPRLAALSAFAVGDLKLSKRDVVKLLKYAFGVEIVPATVIRYEKEMSEALEAAYSEAKAILETEPSAHVDETGWQQKNQPAWLWGAKSPRVTVYQIARYRNRETRNSFLGKFAGVLISDRLSTYADWKLTKWQVCWAHIRRDFKGFSETDGKTAELGKQFLTVSDTVFHQWHEHKRGEKTFRGFQQDIKSLKEVIHGILEDGLTSTDAKMPGTCLNLLKWEEALWTFARTPGIEPTNNTAEQTLRPGVIYRKKSHGTQSEGGSRFLERIFTAIQTLKQHNRNVIEFLVNTTEAWLNGVTPPLLVPTNTS